MLPKEININNSSFGESQYNHGFNTKTFKASSKIRILRPEANVIELFAAVIYEFLYKAIAFVPGKLFKPGLTSILA